MNTIERLFAEALNRFRFSTAASLPDIESTRAALKTVVKDAKDNYAAHKSTLTAQHAGNSHVCVREPGGEATIRFDGELLAEPDGWQDALQADSIALVFGRATGGCGSVAYQMIDELQASEARVTATILESAASAHALLFLAAEERVMKPGSRIMFHGPCLVEVGNLQTFRKAVTALEEMAVKDVRWICERTGLPTSVVRDWICGGEDFWFSDAEAACLGFVNGARPTPAG